MVAQIGGCIACVGVLVDHDNLGDLFDFVRSFYEQKLQRQGKHFSGEVQQRRDRYMVSGA